MVGSGEDLKPTELQLALENSDVISRLTEALAMLFEKHKVTFIDDSETNTQGATAIIEARSAAIKIAFSIPYGVYADNKQVLQSLFLDEDYVEGKKILALLFSSRHKTEDTKGLYTTITERIEKKILSVREKTKHDLVRVSLENSIRISSQIAFTDTEITEATEKYKQEQLAMFIDFFEKIADVVENALRTHQEDGLNSTLVSFLQNWRDEHLGVLPDYFGLMVGALGLEKADKAYSDFLIAYILYIQELTEKNLSNELLGNGNIISSLDYFPGFSLGAMKRFQVGFIYEHIGKEYEHKIGQIKEKYSALSMSYLYLFENSSKIFTEVITFFGTLHLIGQNINALSSIGETQLVGEMEKRKNKAVEKMLNTPVLKKNVLIIQMLGYLFSGETQVHSFETAVAFFDKLLTELQKNPELVLEYYLICSDVYDVFKPNDVTPELVKITLETVSLYSRVKAEARDETQKPASFYNLLEILGISEEKKPEFLDWIQKKLLLEKLIQQPNHFGSLIINLSEEINKLYISSFSVRMVSQLWENPALGCDDFSEFVSLFFNETKNGNKKKQTTIESNFSNLCKIVPIASLHPEQIDATTVNPLDTFYNHDLDSNDRKIGLVTELYQALFENNGRTTQLIPRLIRKGKGKETQSIIAFYTEVATYIYAVLEESNVSTGTDFSLQDINSPESIKKFLLKIVDGNFLNKLTPEQFSQLKQKIVLHVRRRKLFEEQLAVSEANEAAQAGDLGNLEMHPTKVIKISVQFNHKTHDIPVLLLSEPVGVGDVWHRAPLVDKQGRIDRDLENFAEWFLRNCEIGIADYLANFYKLPKRALDEKPYSLDEVAELVIGLEGNTQDNSGITRDITKIKETIAGEFSEFFSRQKKSVETITAPVLPHDLAVVLENYYKAEKDADGPEMVEQMQAIIVFLKKLKRQENINQILNHAYVYSEFIKVFGSLALVHAMPFRQFLLPVYNKYKEFALAHNAYLKDLAQKLDVWFLHNRVSGELQKYVLVLPKDLDSVSSFQVSFDNLKGFSDFMTKLLSSLSTAAKGDLRWIELANQVITTATIQDNVFKTEQHTTPAEQGTEGAAVVERAKQLVERVKELNSQEIVNLLSKIIQIFRHANLSLNQAKDLSVFLQNTALYLSGLEKEYTAFLQGDDEELHTLIVGLLEKKQQPLISIPNTYEIVTYVAQVSHVTSLAQILIRLFGSDDTSVPTELEYFFRDEGKRRSTIAALEKKIADLITASKTLEVTELTSEALSAKDLATNYSKLRQLLLIMEQFELLDKELKTILRQSGAELFVLIDQLVHEVANIQVLSDDEEKQAEVSGLIDTEAVRVVLGTLLNGIQSKL